jgi:hypothetical protein
LLATNTLGSTSYNAQTPISANTPTTASTSTSTATSTPHGITVASLTATSNLPGSSHPSPTPTTPSATSTPQYTSIQPWAQTPNLDESIIPMNMLDLELLHNYVTLTVNTTTSIPVQRNLYRTAIPQLAFRHEYLMRAILAFSALHLAYFRPERRSFYIAHAIAHHDMGLREASASIAVPLGADTACALFAFSSLTSMIVMARPRADHDILLANDRDGVPDWIKIMRSLRALLSSSIDLIQDSSVGLMIKLGGQRFMEWLDATQDNPHMTDLEEIFTSQIRPELVMVSAVEKLVAYETALKHLRATFNIMERHNFEGKELNDVFIWIFNASDRFLAMLTEKEPFALVILAWYGINLKYIEHHWWVQGWDEHIIQSVWRMLSKEHRVWIQYPIEEIGWIPPN